ncbi:PPK2 family polyphosphate kinase [Streptomyces spiramenti]|uniref:Polyphosphate kinase 2 family protein n=1 Tax=Streptomyces spiramenti TaxID=2720606 RepID=A0ABX1AHB5_9ACTN|nr:PPK2 family polyphosphate kinase [Streptomyces spiramenti]NJP65061.1 polyphosphate kinase 2 family protein [Streptomyces spiramenti]
MTPRNPETAAGGHPAPGPVSALLRVHGAPVDLASLPTGATPGFPPGRDGARHTRDRQKRGGRHPGRTRAELKDDKRTARRAAERTAGELASLQERLHAAATAGDRRRVLLVLQGMDTSGKGGTVKHVVGAFDPAGCRVHAFKAPTPEELAHHFLWRVDAALPPAGAIAIFDRSHYEDVLIARVRGLVPPAVWTRRYDEINAWESSLAADGVTLVKVFLHVGRDRQRARLLRRLDDPDRRWKFSPDDVAERALWPAYREAYEAVLERCSTEAAPWYVVPADRKWYRNWAVGRLLAEHLTALDPRFPRVDLDTDRYRAQLLAS